CSLGHPRSWCRLSRRATSSWMCGSKSPGTHSHCRSDVMDFEQRLKLLADSYTSKGDQVTVRPNPEELPPFAKGFKVETLARRSEEGVLVSVKKNRAEFEADRDIPRYAEITSSQPGWRFDFAILEGEGPMEREGRDAQEPSDEELDQQLAAAEGLA